MVQIAKALFTMPADHKAAKAGQYAGWRAAPTYLGVREMHARIRWINDTTNECQNVLQTKFCETLVCPENYARRTCEGIMSSCAFEGLACPEGVHCVC